MRRAFAYSRSQGVLNVAATGNFGEDHSDKPGIPLADWEDDEGPLPARLRDLLAQMPGVAGVGQVFPDGDVTASSVTGFQVTDLAAVGEGKLAIRPNRYRDGHLVRRAGRRRCRGTGQAAAAGLAPARVPEALFEGARARTCEDAGWIYSEQPCRTRGELTTFFGHGELDALGAVEYARTHR